MQEAGLENVEAARRLADAWRRAVPERFCLHTRLVRLQAGVLEVGVRSSAVLYELEGFYRGEILRRLREAGAADVADIKFKVEGSLGEDGNT
ncbi:MAG: DUF721 domain-containing protein [Planctomycetes bacterium]|nr:DUF721 domain-containing protein [Planctomycetota bacterium]